VERAIDACVRAHPHADRSIAPETAALADIYGLMIYRHAEEINFTSFVEGGAFEQKHVDAINQFYGLA
jgi:hypothetical protein